MNSSSVWNKGSILVTVTLNLIFIFIFIVSPTISRFYDVGERRLKISPKDCTSLKYPKSIGTCMFNLECKEKGGFVIGACVDRFLFGACCDLAQKIESQQKKPLNSSENVSSERISSTTNRISTSKTKFPKDPPLSTKDEDISSKQTFEPIPITKFVSTSISKDTSSSSVNSIPISSHKTENPLPNHINSGSNGITTLFTFTPEFTTVLPIFMEALSSSSDTYTFSNSGINSYKYSENSRFPVNVEQQALKTIEDEIFITTEEPPKLSTFLYVDSLIKSHNNEGNEKEMLPTTTIPTVFPNEQSTISQILDSTNHEQDIDSSTDRVWSIVQQLASSSNSSHQTIPSSTSTLTQPAIPKIPLADVQLNSDELYTALSGIKPTGSILENRIQTVSSKPLNTNTWYSNPTTNSPEKSTWPPEPSSILPSLRPQGISSTFTSRPWASSTYQIHTIRYPETTPFPASGLVTWGGVIAEQIHLSPKTTSEIPIEISFSSSTMKDIKPVAEVTVPPRTTTTSTTTEPTTTLKAKITTSSPTITIRPTIRTTSQPKSPKPVTKYSSPKPKPKPNIKVSVYDNQIKKPTKTPGILQSDFDTNIDDFVNQVVQNLAGSLDNLDLDEVILQPPSISSGGSPSIPSKLDQPPTLHPFNVLSDPSFQPLPIIGQIPLIKPSKPQKKVTISTTTSTTTSRPLDYRRDCGVRPLNKQGRIVGGSASSFGKWPWQALVREATWLGLFSKNKCGGVLISPKYVLTAAHCQPGFLATLTVVLGDFDISSETEGSRISSNSITKNVRRVIVHRDYNAQTFENDIALLELETAVEYQPHIVPICLPTDNEVYVGRKAIVTGWGRLKYGGTVPNQLHEVDVPILNNTDCQNMFLKSGHIKAIRDSFLCAGYAQGIKDSCEGDSGGPLSLMRPNGQWILAGTVSHGIKCAFPNLPGVYMRMTYYKPWIKRVTGISVS